MESLGFPATPLKRHPGSRAAAVRDLL